MSRGILRCFGFTGAVLMVAFLALTTRATVRYVDVNSANPLPPFTSWGTAAVTIQDAVDVCSDGDQVLVTNGVYRTGGRAVNGLLTNRLAVTRRLRVQSMNGPAVTALEGFQVPGTTYGDSAVRCLYLTNGAQFDGFTLTNGATRPLAFDTPDSYGGGAWCESVGSVLSNCWLTGNSASTGGGGSYSGTLLNCRLFSNSTFANSGGPAGGGASFLSSLSNCVLSGNYNANGNGGAVANGTLSHCVVSNNSCRIGLGGGIFASMADNSRIANNSAAHGGGSYGSFSSTLNYCAIATNIATSSGGGAEIGTLNSCLIVGNFANAQGGGAMNATLNNCTVIGNVANSIGGASGSTVRNTILYFNTPTDYSASTVTYCCTTPLPSGTGNFTNAPQFIDFAGGNLRLQTNSPCINTGNSGYATNAFDLDGRPRIVGAAVDVGAYEFQAPGLGEFINWLAIYGIPTGGSSDTSDSDGDGMGNWQEWLTGTVPTDASSLLKLTSISPAGVGIAVSWQSVTNRLYRVQRSTNLAVAPSFLTIGSNLTGQPTVTSYNDTTAVGIGPFFYRVGIQP